MPTAELPVVTTLRLESSDRIPNNPLLPVLVYRGALPEADPESFCRKRLRQNDWGNIWIDGVFGFHHYHSNAHEFLGVLDGHARLLVGGEDGSEIVVRDGDALVLPAGTGHKKLDGSSDFRVLGAYPGGRDYNMNYGREGEWDRAKANISRVPLPERDPLFGPSGPLREQWCV